MVTKIEVILHGGTGLDCASLALELIYTYPDANLTIISDLDHTSFTKISNQRNLAQKILEQYQNVGARGKIGCIKAAHSLNPSLSIREAKTLVEDLFDFQDNDVTIKEDI